MTMPHPAKADIAGLIASLEQAIAEASPKDAPRLLGDLERLKAFLWGRLLGSQAKGNDQAPPDEDRLLTVKEASQMLSVSKDWLYRNASKVPFAVRVGKRHLRFSARRIERYIRQRQGR